MACVQDHHIRVIGRSARNITEGRQYVRHAGGVVEIHLAAICLDEEFLGHARYAVRQVTVSYRKGIFSKFAAKGL